jgi:squalene cyclase
MTLLAARWYQRGPEQRELVHRAARVLMSAQRTSDGSWDQQLIRGVFNRNCMITYNYETVFAIWALGRYRRALQTDLVA